MAAPPLKIYGVYPSQPCRAVIWLCDIKRIPWELVKTTPRQVPADFFLKNPSGKVPCIEDQDITLYEAPAILAYLCTKHGFEDMYPTGDILRRAKIDQYLHWHHENTRKIAAAYMAPALMAMNPKYKPNRKAIEFQCKAADKALKILDTSLSKHAFIVDDSLSVADLSAYEEISQLDRWKVGVNLESRFPNIARWVKTMKTLPHHDSVHRVLGKLAPMIQGNLQKHNLVRSKM